MITPPVEPSSGDRISASWMRSFVRYVRAIRPIAGPGVKSSVTPNGTILSCPLNPRPAAKPVDNGCWNIVAGERDGENVRQFGNQYYLKGEVLVELDLEDAVEDFVCQGELSENQEYTAADKPFVALKVPAAAGATESPTLEGYKSLSELQTAQSNVAYIVKLLYKLTHGGGIKVDFRNCPALQVAEVL